MARLPRLRIPGVATHVIVRGNNRQAIFSTDGDRVFFHRCLAEVARQCGLAVHAYVLMTNHVHLLATEQRTEALADTVQAMGRRYVSYFNFLHRRTGTLWEGRYRSTLIESERYLLCCQRYIEMNPVRAGIVLQPEDFHWSSHRYYVAGIADDLVTPHTMFLSLGESEAVRRRAYAALFEAQVLDEEIQGIRDAVNKGWAMGSDGFCHDVERLTGRAASPRSLGRPRKARDAGGSDLIFTE